MTGHSAELAALRGRFRTYLAAVIEQPPRPLSATQEAELARQARIVENALAALDRKLDGCWRPVQEALAVALTPHLPRALVVDRAAHRRRTRHRNRRNR